MSGPGIAVSLREFGRDEGTATALAKAEKWRNVLDEMSEVANDHQRAAINELLYPLNTAIDILLSTLEEKKEQP